MNTYFVYILMSRKHYFYVGITNSLKRRVYQHKKGMLPGHTSKHDIHCLVYYEEHEDIYTALRREKRLKRWNRDWKMALVKSFNPYLKDLYVNL